MTCAEALQSILEADPLDLEEQGDSTLAVHLRECHRCREAARAVLFEESALAEGLTAAVAPPDLDALLDQALGSDAKARVLRFRPRRFGLTLLPMAAAAAMAALFLGSEPQLPGDPYIPPELAPGLGLEVPEGQDVAVLATNNPEITVVWFF